MKYLTREWATGELPEEDAEAALAAYRASLEHLLLEEGVPEALRELADRTTLHDVLICWVRIEKPQRRLSIRLLAGDRDGGYHELDIEYGKVEMDALDREILASRARDRRTEILYDELERIGDGMFEHRLLLWPQDELVIRFREIDLERTPREERSVVFVGDPYEEVDG